MLVSLHHGTQVRIRPVEPGDKQRLQRGLRGLSPETVRRRFLAAKPAFSDHELRYLTEVDGVDHLALVAVLADDPRADRGRGPLRPAGPRQRHRGVRDRRR
jgi:hypothetical protein